MTAGYPKIICTVASLFTILIVISGCGQFDFAVNPALLLSTFPAAGLTVSGPSSFTLNGQCDSQPIQITAVDAKGKEAAVKSTTRVSLNGVPSGLALFSDSGCKSKITPSQLSLNAGSSHLLLYGEVTQKGSSSSLSLSASAVGLTPSVAHQFPIIPIPWSIAFDFNVSPSTITIGACSNSAVRVVLKDYQGDPVAANGTVDLVIGVGVGAGGASVFSDSRCQQPLSLADYSGDFSLAISNSSSASFWIVAPQNGNVTVTAQAADGSLASASPTLRISVQPVPPYFRSLALTPPQQLSGTLYFGFCGGPVPITVTALDQYNQPYQVPGGLTVYLNTNLGSASFYRDSGCSSSVSSVFIPSMSSSVQFYVIPTALDAGQIEVSAYSSAFSTQQSYPVSTGGQIALSLSGPSAIYNGQKANYTVSVQDPYGNAYNASTSLNLDLSTNANYSGSICSSTITSSCSQVNSLQLVVPANTSSTFFELRPSGAQTVSFWIDSPVPATPAPLSGSLTVN